jgi:hypothetical protein
MIRGSRGRSRLRKAQLKIRRKRHWAKKARLERTAKWRFDATTNNQD